MPAQVINSRTGKPTARSAGQSKAVTSQDCKQLVTLLGCHCGPPAPVWDTPRVREPDATIEQRRDRYLGQRRCSDVANITEMGRAWQHRRNGTDARAANNNR